MERIGILQCMQAVSHLGDAVPTDGANDGRSEAITNADAEHPRVEIE